MTGEERVAWVREQLDDQETVGLFDGLEDAIVGIARQQHGDPLVVYDMHTIIAILMGEDQELTEEDAWDHFGFNIQGLYFGKETPLILQRVDE